MRISSINLAYWVAFLPGYKYFSPGYTVPGFRGRVVEIGLIYTTILGTNLELRVPNSVLLDSGVVDYTPRWSEK